MRLAEGQCIETYTVKQELGHGGMGDVYLARDDAHERDVVLKFPHEELMGDPKAYEHFQREVKIGQILNHPNIQKLHTVGGETHSPFLVLEYVPGCTLRSIIYRRSQCPDVAVDIPAQIAIGIQIATALACAHRNHVTHRDLKPENILVMPDGTAKVMDFGIAYIEGARRVTWGMIADQAGTPDYMAPEQIKGVRGDHRTDIYALGMILYESLTGRLPYDGDNALVIMNQHVTMPSPSLREFYPDIPVDIEEVIMKAIRRNPSDRWQTMEAFAEALKHPDPEAIATLRAEREREMSDTPSQSGSLTDPLRMPVAKLILLALGTLIVLAAVGLLIQWLHSRTH